MSRLPFYFLALTFLVGGDVFLARAIAQPTLPGVMRIAESKPVIVKGVQFALVAQTDWVPAKPDNLYPVSPIELQLRITNLGKDIFLFSKNKTFGIKIFNSDGTEVKAQYFPATPTATKPVFLAGGASFTLNPCAELRWDKKTKTSELALHDEIGGKSVFGSLEPGSYKIVFWFAVKSEQQAPQKTKGAMAWAGEAVTKEVIIRIKDELARGFPPTEPIVKPFTEPLLIQESKAILKNGAQFVVAADCNWKISKEKTPIEIQLRITNLGNNEMIFPTFDTFGLIIQTPGGKSIFSRGGRDATAFTRPVLIPPGASYTLCRKAELRWNTKNKENELCYWDGTLNESIFGSIHPGQYKISFYYSAASNEPFAKAWERQHNKLGGMRIWFGRIITNELTIKAREP